MRDQNKFWSPYLSGGRGGFIFGGMLAFAVVILLPLALRVIAH